MYNAAEAIRYQQLVVTEALMIAIEIRSVQRWQGHKYMKRTSGRHIETVCYHDNKMIDVRDKTERHCCSTLVRTVSAVMVMVMLMVH